MRCNTCGEEVREDCDHNHTTMIGVHNASAFFFTLMSRLMLLSAGVALSMSSIHPLHIAAAGFLIVSAIVGIIGDVFNG